MNSSKKIIRQEHLSKMLERNPFLTDEQLAKALEVSIQTIRLDRLRMNIPEVRERTRQMAETAQTKVESHRQKRYCRRSY
ncbi:MAG: HTH domain-containing protein [Phascolarctobacterium faecium]